MLTKTRKNNIPQSIEKYIGCVFGTPARGDLVPIDVELHVSQRPLKLQQVYKYIAKVKGLDWNLFGHVTVIRRRSDGMMKLINGQHRRRVAKVVDPTITHIPGHIIDASDEEFESYGAALFSQFNGIVSKALSNEELYHARVLALDPDALRMKKILEDCGLSCGKVNDSPTSLPVAYATFEKCLKLGETATIRSVELSKKGFGAIADDPLHGMVFALAQAEYKDLGDPETRIGKDFEEWFTKAIPMFHTLSDLKFKKYRNNPSWQKGIAYGLINSFAKFQRKAGKKDVPKVKTIKAIYEKGLKKEDSGLLD